MPKISAVIPDDVAALLKKCARVEDRSVSSIIRRAVAEHVGRVDAAEGDQNSRGWHGCRPWRNRWPEVQAFDDRVADLDRRQQELHDQLADLHQRRQTADADHAARLAKWMADPQGERPRNEAQLLGDAIAEARAEHGAIDLQRDDVLAEKVALVERRRESLVR